nr:immunoglobulin light chain junction region [Macaca mulatta]MPO03492.1 immunoglobulin light chain junction region [Macaca mulatta]MPO06878.1 immunoglobulin light chain junction region [Macaca mulatta]MPO07296.1 immunoglobulin light chain junction region [Macaca mulatta]MPO07813.1 immunoglobulin light chain junction region [Macaca mulatta]
CAAWDHSLGGYIF